MKFIGVISDTHGLLRPQALAALQGSECIIHAGDIGAPHVIETLREIAPVTAIRGNVDQGEWAKQFPLSCVLDVFNNPGLLLHNIAELNDEEKNGKALVIYGHSHKPENRFEDGVLYFNPGSAGPRRFKLPIAVGKLYVDKNKLRGEILALDI